MSANQSLPGVQTITPTGNEIVSVSSNTVSAGVSTQAIASLGSTPSAPFPSTTSTLFGGGTATFPEEGNIYRYVSSTGTSPGATGADNVIATYTLPAGSFDVSGRGIQITASGSFAGNTDAKTIKIIFNPASATLGSTVGASGTTVATTGSVTTNGGGWQISANVFKYGTAGSNTQLGVHSQAQVGAAVSALVAPTSITATESGAIFVAVTANTTTATDVVVNWVEINAMN